MKVVVAMQINHIIGQFKNELAELYGKKLKSVVLYGSWARAEATEKSDIDLLVALEGKIKPGLEIDRMVDIITEINLEHQVLLSVYPVSENDYHVLKSPILMNIRKEGIEV